VARPRKLKVVEAKPAVVPECVRESRVYQRRKVTKRKLPSFTEAMMLLHAPEALRLYWEALLNGLKAGDKTALETAGEIFNYVRGKGMTFNLTQQMLAQQQAAGETAPVVGFDAFVRQLAEARADRALPAPAEVIDAEPVEAVAETAGG
jgi:hypothetical protein